LIVNGKEKAVKINFTAKIIDFGDLTKVLKMKKMPIIGIKLQKINQKGKKPRQGQNIIG